MNTGEFGSPQTLAYDINETNQQFRIDLVAMSAPVDSLAQGDVLTNIFHTSPGDPDRGEPADVAVDVSRWQGRTVRLRLPVSTTEVLYGSASITSALNP